MINRSSLSTFGIIGLIAGCSPTVKVEAPDKPIVINMNMKIEHTVKMAVKKDLEKAEKDNPDVFD
jgi:hypothetical protein